MRRGLSVLLVLVMTFSLLTGCQSTGNETDETGYKYDQEENIIDDNYRNYYQIFVYSFYDSDGDGIGDLNGVTQKLDYIAEMGYNGIWLLPIMPSTTYHKYDVIDYMAIDEQYGTMEDFETLLEECHKRDIRLLIDLVVNHSSSEHPWFLNACEYLRGLEAGKEPSAEENQYFGYYHFTKEKKNDTYYNVAETDWYYEGSFWSGMPDLNYDSEELKKEFESISDFWLEKGIDGYRMDAVMHIDEVDDDYNNAVINWLYNYCLEQNPNFYMVSEIWSTFTTIQKYYESQTPSMFNFDAAQQNGYLFKTAKGYMPVGDLISRMLTYDKYYSEANPNYIDAVFLVNHDIARGSEVCVNNVVSMKMGAGLMMMMNGSTFTYYGEEIGLPGASDIDQNKRLPMDWSSTSTRGETKGPEGCTLMASAFMGVEQQLEDPDSLLNYYKRAIEIRNENPEIARGEIKKIESLCTNEYGVMTKTYEGSTIAIAINNRDEACEITLTDSEIAEMQIRGYLTILSSEEVTLENGVLTLPAKSICVLK